MKIKEKNINPIVISIVMILLVMMISVFFRIMTAKTVYGVLGENYIDTETGVPYLTEMDSYYHLRMTRDIMESGHAGEDLKDGEPWDTLSYAPYGRSAAGYSPLMAYITISVTKFISLFRDFTLEKTAYWQGAFLSALIVIPVFIMVFRLQGIIAAGAASILAALNYGYFLHTVPGFYDTDTVISWVSSLFFCFSMLLIDSFVKEDGKDPKIRRILYAALFFLNFILLIMSWNAYALFIGILVFSLFIFFLMTLKGGKASSKGNIIGSSVLLVLIIIGIIIADRGFFNNLFRQLAAVFNGGNSSLFPDTYVSVSEMRKPSLIAGGFTGLFQMKVLSESNIGIINAVGGIIPFILALVMWVMMIIKTVKGERKFEHILLMVWYLLTLILSFRSWRFIMLFAVPVAILSGMLLGKLCALIKDRKMMDYQVYAAMMILLVIFPALYGAYRANADSVPGVNRFLHDPLMKIRTETDENTIIASWWDYGYFYEEKAKRRTVFDGGSQNGMRVFWIGKALATDNELLSRNIVKMLAGNGDHATEEMTAAFGENRETLKLMTELLSSDKMSAEKALSDKGLSSEKASEIAALLFPEVKDEVLFIITSDMAAIARWYAVFGFYNEEGALTEDDYSLVMNNVEYKEINGKAAWRFGKGKDVMDFMIENNDGVPKAYTSAQSEDTESIRIDRIIKTENGVSTEYPGSEDSTGKPGWTVFLNMDGASPTVTVVTTPMYESVFGRLYYRGGSGMEHYEFSDLSGGTAFVYRVV